MILDCDVLVIPGKDPGSTVFICKNGYKNGVVGSFTKRYGLA